MDWTQTLNTATPAALCIAFAAAIILAFGRGWVFTSFQVKTLIDQANQRADDYKTLHEADQVTIAALTKQLDKLTIVGEAVDKILNALPIAPNTGVESERVER